MTANDNAGMTGNGLAMAVLNAIQNPVVMVDANGHIAFANWEAEAFFGASAAHLARYRISTFIPWQPASVPDRAGARASRAGQRVSRGPEFAASRPGKAC